MTRIEGQCHNCHKPIQFEFQQTVIQEQLRWYLSYNCSFCGFSVELDDIGLLPEDVRQKNFQEEGEWEIIIEDFEQQKQSIIKSLRQITGLSTIDLYQKLKRLRSRPGVIESGTKFEMNWLHSRLQLDGIESIFLRRKELE
jgi:hypothetical protein